MFPIADLHCDLLTYLYGDPTRCIEDAACRCSVSQMHQGHVHRQVMAVWAMTEPGSSQRGEKQWHLFNTLLCHPSKAFSSSSDSHAIQIFPAIENASAFAEEGEPFQQIADRLSCWLSIAKPLYISLTWNGENRFGGGAGTTIGLKEDGKRLLDLLHKKGIAVDLSHASDPLAEEIFAYIDQCHLQLPVIASHSNFRKVTPHIRNLPDDLAIEIVHRGGVMGFNFIYQFVGEGKDPFLTEHLAHALDLNIAKGLCFGGDFFYDGDLPEEKRTFSGPSFFEEAPNASVYPKVLSHWKKSLGLSDGLMSGIAHQHFSHFFRLLQALQV